MKSKEWLNRQKNDYYVIKAKQKGYFSRSAFKLLEIEQEQMWEVRFPLIFF